MSATLEAKMESLLELVEDIHREQQKRQELFEDLTPILKSALQLGSERIEELERQGYFRLARGLVQISERVATHYGPEDLNKLADGVVGILDTVRSLTQPEVLSIVDEAVEVIHNSDRLRPAGARALFKASRDQDVQRGLAIIIEVLRHLGAGVQRIKSSSSTPRVRTKTSADKLGALLGPRLRHGPTDAALPGAAVTRPHPTARASVDGSTGAPSAPLALKVEGIEFTPDGFCLHPEQWTEELARTIAAAAQFSELSAGQWDLIRFARQEFLRTKASPNLRRMSIGSGLTTKEIYTLFPKAPAKTICRIAGIPKPVGCI